MPRFTDEELRNIKALQHILSKKIKEAKEKYSDVINMNFDELGIYLGEIYKYTLDRKNDWKTTIKELDANDSNIEVMRTIEKFQAELEDRVSSLNYKQVFELNNKNDYKSKAALAAKRLEYEQLVPIQDRTYVSKVEYLQLMDETCFEVEKEYNDFILEVGKDAEKSLVKEQENSAAYINAQLKIDKELNTAEKQYLEKMKEYEEQKALLKDNSEKLNEYKESVEVAKEKYEKLMVEKTNALIESSTFDKSRESELLKLNKICAKNIEISSKVAVVVKNTIDKLIKDRKSQREKKVEGFKKELQQELSNIDNIEISDEIDVKDVKEKTEPIVGYDIPRKTITSKAELLAAVKEIVNKELSDSISDSSIDSISNSTNVVADSIKSSDDQLREQIRLNRDGLRQMYNRECVAVKKNIDKEQANLNIGTKESVEKIRAIGVLLKANKKKGFTSDSAEYRRLLNKVDDFEKKYKDNGWEKLFAQNDKNVFKLSGTELNTRAQMVQELEELFEAGEAYMVAKGPQLKYWDHGKKRYELSFLLCDEIYKFGGLAADNNARIAALDKEAEKAPNNQYSKDYLKQIPNRFEGNALLTEKYKDSLEEAKQKVSQSDGKKIMKKKLNESNNIIPENKSNLIK
ncbi:hypothetical protein SAMN04487830_1272 [Pseudobutyrivibrio sp. OR37]|uniref:hypothetical protein n=1 Tax=Pseudobutyrivibrio sp. OR37 TaxID=1798186 RepID=UPI0008EC7DE9|nr:hypothetical protein [Pseudobutyrivibrio sp. OR37]SFI16611.1 hypothetical protein SAMN04487830_1272 [Pseudobutyrivibrio sp. OR37]